MLFREDVAFVGDDGVAGGRRIGCWEPSQNNMTVSTKVILSAANVILSAAKDLTAFCERFFAALRMTGPPLAQSIL